jgi:single-stranded-DNA-specific exonuclease
MLSFSNRPWQLRVTAPTEAPKIPGLSAVTTQILYNRGITDSAQAQVFLRPDLNQLIDPHKIKGVPEAVKRIQEAITKQEKITIYGDYDVDGIVGVVVLMRLFKLLGYQADYYIPHRIDEGYGLNTSAIDKLKANGTSLIITVDCGISSCDEIRHAKEIGIDMIITDHHEPDLGAQLPDAVAIINPKLSPEPFTRNLAGAGVALKLAWAMLNNTPSLQRASPLFQNFVIDAMTLVAIGTVADVVPLLGENRVLVYYGLQSLKACKITGLKALMSKSRINGNAIQPKDIAYGLAPRINAGGRLNTAARGVDLLLTESDDYARTIAEYLEQTNRERQKIEGKILDQARQKLRQDPKLAQNPVLVIAEKSWHPGVIGIVASKIAEEFYRPTIIISINGKKAKGSGRSVPGFHLYNALADCRGLFTSFGGHALAAGLEIDTGNIPELINRLNTYAKDTPPPDATSGRAPLLIDAELTLDGITRQLMQELDMLAPFGEGNPEPVFASHNVRLAGEPRLMGANSTHLNFFVNANKAKSSYRVVAFGHGDKIGLIESLKDKEFSIAYNVRLNRWNGHESVELYLKDLKTDPA